MYEDQQDILQEAGIANSAIAKEEIEDLFNECDSTVAALLAERDNKFDALNQKFEALLASTIVKSPPAQVNVNPNDLMSVMTELTKSLSSASSFNSNNSNNRRKRNNNNKGPRLTRMFQTDHYCWSHGCDLVGDHTSANCNNRKTGHQADATIDNRKGGSAHYLSLVRPTSN